MSLSFDPIRDRQRDTWDRFSAGWKKWDAAVLGWQAPFGEARRCCAAPPCATTPGCSTSRRAPGEPGLTAAARLPHGRVTLTDLSERMLAVAADSAARRGLRNVDTRVCDAAALPFADAVLCRFGFVFFPDVDATVREFIRVAKPGARICAAVWGEPAKNPWAATVMATIARHVPMPAPPPGAPGLLFRCASPGFMRDAYAAAGLRDIVEEELSSELAHDTPQRYWEFMTDIAAPVVAGMAKADDAARERIRAEVLDQARQALRNGAVRLQSTATVTVGTR